MQDAREEIRARLAIEDVIGEYVQLKRAGRNFKGLSPFTGERTPSFVVSPEKQIWHDFSSGRGGDVFSFVMEVEGLEFREVLEQLARKAGVELSSYAGKQAGDIAKRKKRFLEANELAARYFQQSLLRNPHAIEYVFKTRGLSKEIVQEFRIGYAPDRAQLTEVLKKKGFSAKEISEAGLANRYGGDLFRGRMMVPLMDTSGQVIGFTGRILSDEPNAPKYLNTPQTLLYDKSRHVFGLSQAKEAVRKQDSAVIVEGNMDVVSSHQAQVRNVVATAGTAMTEWHLKTLSRLSGNVKLAFDGDKAGLAATERAIPIAQKVGVELTIVSLPPSAKDPDELIQQDVALWSRAIDAAQPVVDWVLERYTEREDMSTAAGKRNFTTAALAVVRNLSDSVETEHYLKKIADLTDTSLAAIQQKLVAGETGDESKPLKKVQRAAQKLEDKQDTHQDRFLAMLLLYPSLRVLLEENDLSIFQDEARAKVVAWLKTHTESIDKMPQELQDFDTYVKIGELKAETRYGSWTESDRQMEAARLLRLIEVEHKKEQKNTLMDELRQAESEGDDTRAIVLRERLHQLIKETARG
ncbi:MAG TPA: DNA primase [Candidatus Saccharimonadales bacterium]